MDPSMHPTVIYRMPTTQQELGIQGQADEPNLSAFKKHKKHKKEKALAVATPAPAAPVAVSAATTTSAQEEPAAAPEPRKESESEAEDDNLDDLERHLWEKALGSMRKVQVSPVLGGHVCYVVNFIWFVLNSISKLLKCV